MTELSSDPVIPRTLPYPPISREQPLPVADLENTTDRNASEPEAGTLEERTPVPQPGLLLSMVWTASVPLSQIIITIPLVMIFGLLAAGADESTRLTFMLTATQAGVLILALAAGAACSLLARHQVFSLAPMRLLHLVAAVALVLPATMLARFGYDMGMQAWTVFTDAVPALKSMDEMNTMAQIDDIVRAVPFPLLLFAMAAVPAIAEEIIFRGIIGRGLVARYGTVAGVLMTSVLFGLAHGHPAHALSVIPLGIVMHVLYLSSRTIWAPILFHFCNNAFAVVGATVLTESGEVASMEQATALPWWIAVAGLCSISAWFGALAVTRTRLLRSDDGSDWDPGYQSTETPRDLETRREYPQLPPVPTIAAALGCVVFLYALSAMNNAVGAEKAVDAALLLLR